MTTRGPSPSQSLPRYARGQTLIELMIVLIVLATIAAITLPSSSSGNDQRLHLAATSVADALRFARAEAKRTSVIYGLSVDPTNQKLQVFRLNQNTTPPVPVFDALHPSRKQPYTIELDKAPFLDITLVTLNGDFVGTCDQPDNIAFDQYGTIRCVDPTSTRVINADIELASAQLRENVAIDSYTGRITLQ